MLFFPLRRSFAVPFFFFAASIVGCSSGDGGGGSAATDSGSETIGSDAGNDSIGSDASSDASPESSSDASIDTADATPLCTVGPKGAAPGLDPTFPSGARPLDSSVNEGEVSYPSALLDDHGGAIVYGRSAVIYEGMFTYSIYARRYDATGTLDPSFPDDARSLILPLGGDPQIDHATFDASGRIVLVGSISVGSFPRNPSLLVMRLTASGNVDASFGTGGYLITQPSGCAGGAGGAKVLAMGDDLWVRTVCVNDASGSGLEESHIFHVDATGHFDTAFPDEGAHNTDVVLSGGAVYALRYDPDKGQYIDKLQKSGAIDASFGTGGSWRTTDPDAEIDQIAATDDGGLMIVTGSGTAHETVKMQRLDARGVVEPSFTQTYDSSKLSVSQWTERCDGEWIGVVTETSGTQYSTARLLPNGAWDTSWGKNGVEAALDVFSKYVSVATFVVDEKTGAVLSTASGSDDHLWMARFE